jgi:hypothetical protein
MFGLNRYQLLMFGAVAVGFILGKILKNFKVGFAIALVIGLLFAANMKRK